MTAFKNESLRNAIADLTTREQQIILDFADGMTYAQIGEHNHITPAAAKFACDRTIKKLRNAMGVSI